MNTASNVFLLVSAAALMDMSVRTISTDLLVGGVEFVLSVAAFLVYELTPVTNS